MMPSRSVSSANISGVHLNESVCGRSVLTTANILPPTLNTRSLPHLMSSVAAGRLRQKVRTASMLIVVQAFMPAAGMLQYLYGYKDSREDGC